MYVFTRTFRELRSVRCLEYSSYEAVQARMDRVVTVVTVLDNVPYMRNAVLCEVVVIALRSGESDNVIGSTAGYEYEMRSCFLAVPFPCALSTRCRTDSADIAELVAVLHTDLE